MFFLLKIIRLFFCSIAAAGAVDEASFFSSFEEVNKINLYSAKELDDTLNKIRECISNTNNDWDKRTEAVSKNNF